MSSGAASGLAVLLAYLAGSFPASYLAGRALRGIDLRRHGSGNLGATNVYRILGTAPAAAVVAVDVGKGLLAVSLVPELAWSVTGGAGATPPREDLRLACGLAAILGHVFPIWLGFRGGKGVATGVGAFLGLSPIATGAAILVWTAGVALTRIVSVASLAMGLSLPVLVYAEQRAREGSDLLVGFAVATAALVLWTHRQNLRRLARGEERRISRAQERSG